MFSLFLCGLRSRILVGLLIVSILCLAAVPAVAQSRTHTVASGENLFRIAQRYGCTTSQIATANNISNPRLIFAGQVLIVPPCSGATTTITTAPTAPTGGTAPTSTAPVNNPSDNWCFPGQPWGDGRCNQGSAEQQRYMWFLGWVMYRSERGEIDLNTLPRDMGIALPPTTASATTTTGGTPDGASGSTTGGGTTTCTTGAVLELVNCARAQEGLGALSANGLLSNAAQAHAQDMVDRNYFSHDAPAPAPNGVTVGDRVTAAGYNWSAVGENIASGYSSDLDVFNGWMNSPGHRANILNPNFTQMGMGRVGTMWVQVFGRP